MASSSLLEIMEAIVNYLAIPDLLRFARISRRMHEMVYDDARWVERLKKMGCWNDTEARTRGEKNSVTTTSPNAPGVRRQSTLDRTIVNGKGRPEILFDSDRHPSGPTAHPARRKSSLQTPLKQRAEVADGFDTVTVTSSGVKTAEDSPDLEEALTVLKRVKSIRGQARQEYGKIYRVLARFYNDVLTCSKPMNTLVFKLYALPEHQAQMLSQIRTFSSSDFSPGSGTRERQLAEIINVFDTTALLEFRKGYEYKDIQGRMKQYARVMYTLNGGQSAVELFLHDNQLITDKTSLGSASDCVDYSLGYGQLSLERVQSFFDRLGGKFSEQKAIIEAVFPNTNEISMRFLDTVADKILSPFLTDLIADAKGRGTSMYMRTVSGTFAATKQFIQDVASPANPMGTELEDNNAVIAKIFEPYLEEYLAEEFAAFKHKADAEIDHWDRALSEQAATTESFLMSNVNRQADKKDFMSSFKKVVMMPVNILPSFSGPATSKTAAKALVNGDAHLPSQMPARSSTTNSLAQHLNGTSALPVEAPTTELAAKAALMTSKLENIRSLFSIEVALNLVHAAKSSLERAAQFVYLSGPSGTRARAHCSSIYVLLLQSIGGRHVQSGFDKAIFALASYNPREVTPSPSLSSPSNKTPQVAPLTTFLELVNVGDLILQMLDVFYESELIRLRISTRDDFLDPSVKAKKAFEAMLDERVAAGLAKGIDVLMGEVEFICATTQRPEDFNPNPSVPIVDIGPTSTAQTVLSLVSSHTGMLTGATEKTLLDVFTAEVGLRLFTTVTKHLKRQRISTTGALALLSDLSAYAQFIATFKNNDLNSYFTALREVGQIYLIEGRNDRELNEMASIISDGERYAGVFTVDEVVEFAERRSDWLSIKGKVEAKVSGDSCVLM